MTQTADYLVVGGGIVGLTIALELRKRQPRASIAVLEKEPAFGQHGSTRNSGVLHAGFYYTADTLKARLTVEGNRRMTEYCLDRKLPINRCGKLVVARNESEVEGLETLLERGLANGVDLEDITEQEARAIEPQVRTHERALFSPSTSSVDPGAVVQSIAEDCRNADIRLEAAAAMRGRNGDVIRTSRGDWSAGFVVNAAGLYADRIAHQYGAGERYAILPFKGVFLVADPKVPAPGVHIYPVPDLAHPFLGVHFTVGVDHTVKIGPSAIPAFWREHYGGLANFSFGEMLEIVKREAGLFLRNDFDFRSLALYEMRKYRKSFLVELAGQMAKDVRPQDYRTWGRPGIRAQLVDTMERKLVMDFVIERAENSLHVLNAVSPAFTCCFSFASLVVDRMDTAT